MKRWDDELWLLTPQEYSTLAPGTRLQCIDDGIVTVGIDPVDCDTRFGCIACGLTRELVEEQGLEHDFVLLLLKS